MNMDFLFKDADSHLEQKFESQYNEDERLNKDKIIISLCGGTGAWEKDYKDNGYTVYNITLPRYDVCNVEFHKDYILFKSSSLIDKDLKIYYKSIYGILAAPPCTEFSFAKSNANYPRNIRSGMEIVIACLKIIWEVQYDLPTPLAKRTNLHFWALENPMGLLKRYLGNPVFTFNPYDFGDGYKKNTGLWGYFNIPKKNPCKEYATDYIHTMSPNGKALKKFDKLSTREISPENYGKLSRQGRRAITPAGFARAFYEANK